MWRKISVLLSLFSPYIGSFLPCSASPEPSGISRLKQQWWWGHTGLAVALCIFLHPRQDKHSGNPHITENLENWNKMIKLKVYENIWYPNKIWIAAGFCRAIVTQPHEGWVSVVVWERMGPTQRNKLLNCCPKIPHSTYSKCNQHLAFLSEQLLSNTWICSYIQPHLNCQRISKNIRRYPV